MANYSLQNLLGAGATQDATSITILKSDLTGLTASATNTGPAILAALIIKASEAATQGNYDLDSTKNIYITGGYSSFALRENVSYRVDQLILNLAKIDSGSTLDPDNY